MGNNTITILVVLVISGLLTTFMLDEMVDNENSTTKKMSNNSSLAVPRDHYYTSRSWPDLKPDIKGFESAMISALSGHSQKVSAIPGFSDNWMLEGPTNVGGRINTILVHPSNSNIIYTGSAAGGIFKTINGGTTWEPIFDDQPFLAIGCLAFDPADSDIIFAGTGDPNISGYPFIGDGIWKSTDAGITWMHLGLTNQRIISKIIIHPTNSNIIYAATMGLPFERDNDRGLYESTDGGNSWNQILFINNDAGIIDLVMDPVNPNILYAAGWNRIRNNEESLVTGPAAKIYKTTDGGTNWNILSQGLPQNDMSRTALAISATNPNVIYAAYVNDQLEFDGLYKTINGGTTWNLQSGNGIDPFFMGGFGWYFGRIVVNPTNDNQLFICGVDIYKTNDGGMNWIQSDPLYETHADKHDVFFVNSNTILLATDGGMYRSVDGGNSWSDAENIPNTQFYRVTYNPFNPGEYSGGTQDNGTISGGSLSLNSWNSIFGGDGFTIIYNPVDPLIYYVETQNGDIWATSDGGVFIDYISGSIDATDRRNWDMQYILSAHDPDVLYTGTYRIYKNTSGPTDNWLPISPDLTDGIVFAPRFHTISTVAESSINQDYLYAGTSDGNVWRSLNGGTTWDNISVGIPDRYITSVKASKLNQDHLFVTVSGYKYNEFIPHVFKSVNNGTSWTDISGNLPQLAVNDILIYSSNENVIAVATDGGVYATINGGTYWERVGVNMPMVPVYDIEHDEISKRIIAGTHARSLYSYSIDSLLISTGVQLVSTLKSWDIYPVPASDVLYVEADFSQTSMIKIYSTSGKLIQQFNAPLNKKFKVDIGKYPNGIYFMELFNNDQKEVKKFIKI